MSNTKTDAQRLADELVHEATKRVCNVAMMPYSLPIDAAKELLRLDAIEQRHTEMMANPCPEWDGKAHMQAIANLRKCLADAEAERNQAQSAIQGFVMTLGEVAAERYQLRAQLAKAAAEEREACIDIVAMHGGSIEIEAAIRARSNT